MVRRQASRADPLTPEQRRTNMSRIRARNSIPEMTIRRGLHALGLRFYLHDRRLPGTPDLVFPKIRAVIFVHGCFWHAHECSLGVMPRSNATFWSDKIARNQARDREAIERLERAGWRWAVVWECALRGPSRKPIVSVLDDLAAFLRSDDVRTQLNIEGLR